MKDCTIVMMWRKSVGGGGLRRGIREIPNLMELYHKIEDRR